GEISQGILPFLFLYSARRIFLRGVVLRRSVVFSNFEFKISKKVLFICTTYTMVCLSVYWMACQ
ncbi:MAG TPA: hypothetical protein VIK42_07075, partial [Bacteroidales bacterium]